MTVGAVLDGRESGVGMAVQEAVMTAASGAAADSDEQRAVPQVQRAGGLFVAGLRIATLVQMLPSAVTAVSVSAHPVLCAFSWVLAGVTVGGIAVLAIVGRRPPRLRWAAVEVLVGVTLLLLGLLTVPVEYRTGSWIGFQSAYSLSVAAGLIGVRDRRTWMSLLGALVVARLVYLMPTVESAADVATVAGELLTLLGLAPLAWAGMGAVQRIAEDADRARETAAVLAREAEGRRARAAIHNGAALIKILVDHAEDVTSGGRHAPPEVWAQAHTELNRMRAYLCGRAGADEGSPHDLAGLLDDVCAEFTDLPVDVVTELARGVRVDEVRNDLANALRSVLINVRQHAHADRVVVHAEELEDGSGWSVTVHDDGVGFDTATTSLGVGLRELTVDQLARRGVVTTLDSHPGHGTTVTMTMKGGRR